MLSAFDLCHSLLPGALSLFDEMNVIAVIAWRFPGAGYRHRDTGALTNVGTNGNYWSSSRASGTATNASNLNFNSSNGLNPLNENNRANGFSVRCVSGLICKEKIIRSAAGAMSVSPQCD